MAGEETKYFFSLSPFQGIFTAEQISTILPKHFAVRDNEDVLEVIINDGLSIEEVQCQVERESDRIRFLTGVDLSPKYFGKQEQGGSVRCRKSFDVLARIVRGLDQEIARQDWMTTDLDVQLRLWQLAEQPGLPLSAKIMLLFQVIEVAYPETNDSNNYLVYERGDNPPEPRTEAKLLRDLAAHGKKQMLSAQVRKYCQHLGISSESHDPTDKVFLKTLGERLPIIQEQARRAIETNITRSSLRAQANVRVSDPDNPNS